MPLDMMSTLFGSHPGVHCVELCVAEATLEQGQSYPWSQDLDFRIFRGMVAKGALLAACPRLHQ